jgi:hypothetical protein
MTTTPDASALRRAALAVSVMHDIDLTPTTGGVALLGPRVVPVDWTECADVVAGLDPDSDEARERLRHHLTARLWCAGWTADALTAAARPVGLPVGHLLHPPTGWTRASVLGGALDLGLGIVGLAPGRPDDVVVVPDAALRAADLDPVELWPAAAAYLDGMAALAVSRWQRDRTAPLRPMGDCDVVTLLGSAVLRAALVAADPSGMRALAAPMRARGWLDLRRIDPAFALAAAAATPPAERGFDRPVLVTADEVVLARSGGAPAEIVLRDPAVENTWERDVLYR